MSYNNCHFLEKELPLVSKTFIRNKEKNKEKPPLKPFPTPNDLPAFFRILKPNPSFPHPLLFVALLDSK
jgi:hypothetical protein